MGKKQHSKDQLYLTRTEHASGEHRGAGKQSRRDLPYKTLPFDCCAISFRPFETPLCTADGMVFELLNIVPFLKKFHRHPVTGQPLAASDLIRLHFHKDAEGVWACPVLSKPFTQFTHIVAIKPTGNVYCYDAVKQMNLKTNHLCDLLDDTPFTRADVIHIQDPNNANRREMEHFSHVVENLHADAKKEGGVRHNEATSRIMQQVAAASSTSDGGGTSTAASSSGAAKKAAAAGGASSSTSSSSLGETRWQQTTGAAAQSLTSTAVPLQTINEIAPLSTAEASRQRYAFAKGLKEKAYAQLKTSHGPINLELHADIAPMACENFLLLLERGYYDRTPVHRLIKSFMVQMGDPTGSGSGGESAWGAPFADEISHRLHHQGGGILSMANSGPGTNGSQFFITFKSAPHLDGKHTIFGRVVGGLGTLETLEALPTDKNDRPTAPVSLLGGSIFVNPFSNLDERMEEARIREADPEAAAAAAKAKEKAKDGEAWFNNQAAQPVAHRAGIGKYIAPQHLGKPGEDAPAAPAGTMIAAAPGAGAAGGEAVEEPPKKKPRGGGGFGNFDGW